MKVYKRVVCFDIKNKINNLEAAIYVDTTYSNGRIENRAASKVTVFCRSINRTNKTTPLDCYSLTGY